MERHCRIYNIYSQPGISIVERYIASYKCCRRRSAQNQSMSLLSCWPNLDNLLSHYNFFSTLKVNFPKMATVTDCDLPYLLSISSMISSFWWFLVCSSNQYMYINRLHIREKYIHREFKIQREYSFITNTSIHYTLSSHFALKQLSTLHPVIPMDKIWKVYC